MKQVYFVHDQEESSAVRSSHMEMAGLEVRLFTNGRDLLDALSHHHPDAVLMDVLIDGRNGFEICAEISERYPQRQFPVLLCSRVYRGSNFVAEARRVGAQGLVELPLEREAFLQRFGEALRDAREEGTRRPAA